MINGIIYDMTPAPGRRHQEIVVELNFQMYSYFKGKPCKLLINKSKQPERNFVSYA
ncbi:MAG: Uma2 family endonuclease [Candidatus Riflebacteria bacterium]|nr:Uma2 family endonuclease [Candidatus Riflebacteria bacterium]